MGNKHLDRVPLPSHMNHKHAHTHKHSAIIHPGSRQQSTVDGVVSERIVVNSLTHPLSSAGPLISSESLLFTSSCPHIAKTSPPHRHNAWTQL